MSYDTELAWAAGFFDGEGCTSLTKSDTDYPIVRMDVNQVDRRPLDRFLEAVGTGKIYGPYRGEIGVGRYVFKSTGIRSVFRVARLLWPHLSEPKREQMYDRIAEWFNARARAGVWMHGKCKRGHHKGGANLKIGPNGEQICRACQREDSLAYYHRTKATA